MVDAALQAFDVGGVDEEFGAVGFEQGDCFCAGAFSLCCTSTESGCVCGCWRETTESSKNTPWLSSKSVMVCHLLVATNHFSPLRRQDRSMTSLLLSWSSAASTACSRAMLKRDSGKR